MDKDRVTGWHLTTYVKGCEMRNLNIIIFLFIFLCTSFGYAFSFTTNNTTVTKTFNKSDAAINELITVTVTFTNSEAASLRGFYYAEQIPQGLVDNLGT